MKMIRLLLSTALLALTVSYVSSSMSGKEKEKSNKPEKPSAKGSIRPEGKVKEADLPGLAKISFNDALKAAQAAFAGSVIKAELEVEDGNLMYSFEIVGSDKKVTEV